MGKAVYVATNQSPIGRGLMTWSDLNEIHAEVNQKLINPIEFVVCPHIPSENCDCRKPKAGLLERIKTESLGPWIFIGDNITDCIAAEKANIDFVFIKSREEKQDILCYVLYMIVLIVLRVRDDCGGWVYPFSLASM